ncbi:hypothetical protein ACFVX9_17810 [Kitasatospora sp. NPDC058243]|uniref:hypothetical protein n=1 Tax=Kitasatospora sp. NPDC058243 TaxID=3346397 RepID=UPI0036DB7285
MLTDELTVSVDGHLKPTSAPALQALDVLWQTVRELPMDSLQMWAMKRLVGSRSTDELERRMNGDEVVDVTISLTDGSLAIVRVTYGDGLTCRQRVAVRYVPKAVKRERGRPERWAVTDRVSRVVVADWLLSESEAREWIRRKMQTATYQSGPAARRAAE